MNRTFFAFAMQHFSLIDLKTFRAVADEGNLTRGAARVHLSPSTVCARIKWNWDVGAEFRISIKKPELQGLRP